LFVSTRREARELGFYYFRFNMFNNL
jgi:hypothetical protein